jgi:short-subunit dehydrogenase
MRSAVITGASGGIGAAFARHLASQGYDLLLVARRAERLQALCAEVRHQHGVHVEVVVADLARLADIERVEQRIAASATIELLINNAGFGTVGTFSEIDLKRQIDMISVHVIASVRLSRAALPGMIARGHGAIINVSSPAAFFPTPGNVTYSATKAYVKTFSEALAVELTDTGVQVQVLCPGFTITEFHATPEYERLDVRSRIPKGLWMSADDVAAASLRALRRGQLICIPGFNNRVLIALGQILGLIGLFPMLAKLFVRRFPARIIAPSASTSDRRI